MTEPFDLYLLFCIGYPTLFDSVWEFLALQREAWIGYRYLLGSKYILECKKISDWNFQFGPFWKVMQ